MVDSDIPSAFLDFMQQAAAARVSGAVEPEAQALRAAAQLHPLDEDSLTSLTQNLIEQQRLGDAIELASIIAQLDSGNARAHFRLGYALQIADRHGEAVAPYRRALALEPTLPSLRSNLAGALSLSNGDLREQTALLEQAVLAHPDDGNAWTNLANAYRQNLDLSGSLEAGERAVQCAPSSALAH